MTASDQLFALAERTKEAEQNVSEAKARNEAELKAQVTRARATSEERATELKTRAEDAQTNASSTWDEVRRQWAGHVAKLREYAVLDAGLARMEAEEIATGG